MPLKWLKKSEISVRRAPERRQNRHEASPSRPLAVDRVVGGGLARDKKLDIRYKNMKQETWNKKQETWDMKRHETWNDMKQASRDDLTRPWAGGPAN